MLEITMLGFAYFLGIVTGVALICFVLYVKDETR